MRFLPKILAFRAIIQKDANRERFVKNFLRKLLPYANGSEPAGADFAENDQIVLKSASHDYRMIETLAAVINSPLFRTSTKKLDQKAGPTLPEETK